MSLDERSESLRIRTSNGVEKQVRITQDPGDGYDIRMDLWIIYYLSNRSLGRPLM